VTEARTIALGAEPPFWDGEHDDTLVCRQVRAETHDVKTFVFAAPEPRRFRFLPGQFLTFGFAIEGRRAERCYTIASPPTRPNLVSITVKRKAGGLVSPWLHDNLRPGMTVAASGPAGLFSAAHHPASKYLFLSGGSGITPSMSMLRACYDLAADTDIVFAHSARSPEDIIFRAELEMMARHMPGLSLAFICEADAPREAWTGHRGRLALPMLRLIAPDLLEREIFTCGPAPYMEAVRAMLRETGFDMARYHEESFELADAPSAAGEAPPAPSAAAGTRYRIEFTRSQRVIECEAGTTILAAARAAGMRPPFACTQGLCGTCKSPLLSGAVDMKHKGGIRQREIDKGLILICCSTPRADLVIER
jgi:ferredoxin-NADP reductase